MKIVRYRFKGEIGYGLLEGEEIREIQKALTGAMPAHAPWRALSQD